MTAQSFIDTVVPGASRCSLPGATDTVVLDTAGGMSGDKRMPTETFYNLKPEKKQAFLDACLREFGMHGYRTASVSRIVSILGIAKGSVYQYFSNKADLYRFLVNTAAKTKFEHIRRSLENETGERDFFALHAAVLMAGADFDFSFPAYSLVIANAMREEQSEELGDLGAELVRQSSDFLASFVQHGIDRGDVRDDVDPVLVVHLVNANSMSLAEYMEHRFDFSLVQQLKHPERPLPFTQAELRRAVVSLITVEQSGLAPSA